jgi:cell division control protein 6
MVSIGYAQCSYRRALRTRFAPDRPNVGVLLGVGIRNIPRSLNTAHSVHAAKMLTHPHVFDEGWVPEDLHARDGETTALAGALKPITTGTDPNPVLISGPPGVGKTATARWVLNDLHQQTPAETVLIDCWTHHRPYQTFTALLQGLGQVGAVQPKVPRERLRERVRRARPDSGVVVVLDEADQLDELDLITNWNAMDGVALVLIVNDRSRFKDRLHREHATIHFADDIPYSPYSEPTLVDILRPRAYRGLDDSAYQETTLEAIAARADGNARTAIKGLRAAADHAIANNTTTLTTTAVEAGVAAARERNRQKTRSKLKRHERIILEIIEALGESKKADIYDAYVDRVGEDQARTRRRVGDYLSKLASYNQIEADGEKRGRTYRPLTPPHNTP